MERSDGEAAINESNLNHHAAQKIRAYCLSDDLGLFFVYNSAGRKIYVLAESTEFALYIALSTGHIRSLANGQIRHPTKAFWRENPGFEGAIKRAIASRQPGVVERNEQFAIVRGKVFSPISEV